MLYCHQNGIYTVDAHYEGKENTAVFIIQDQGQAAIVDTAANSSWPYLLEALKELNIKNEEILYVCLTHIHLDHAGGAGLYMQNFPNARLLVHERGARHMANPKKLVAGVEEVYGKEETLRMYGEVIPVPEERITAVPDGFEFKLGARTISCFYTPGHAKHHMSFWDSSSSAVFAGDAFGISYPNMAAKEGRAIFPTTSPVQFDPTEMIESIDKICALNPKLIYLTHFSEITEIDSSAEFLRNEVEIYANASKELKGDKPKIEEFLRERFRLIAKNIECKDKDTLVDKMYTLETELNSQGLVYWYKKAYGKTE